MANGVINVPTTYDCVKPMKYLVFILCTWVAASNYI